MDIHTATEQAYRNGYEAGKREAEPKWISVTERLPEVMTPVLVMHRYEPYDKVTIGYRFQPDKRRKPYWRFFAYWMGDDMMHHAIGDHMICPGDEYVTHWTPISNLSTK